ncbi:hypothetical protein ACQR1N_32170 [Bradyrhizobium sp. HKCCYLRH1073]|uniref:hypothetical protein n=1 Tax=unclassified Bradyrhizobium TaxID=2631580 RepID=UPI003EB8D08A
MESWVRVEDHVGGYDSDGLVILQEGRRGQRLERIVETRPGQCVISLGELVVRRLRGARLLSPSLELSEIEEVVPIGIAGPRTLGARMCSYILLLVLGWLTLSIPFVVRLQLSKSRFLTLEEAEALVIKLIRESSMDQEHAARMEERVRNQGQAPTAEASRPSMLLIAIALGSPSHAAGSAGDIEHVKVE